MGDEEPPDPGGASLQVGCNVIIDSNVDTDSSTSGIIGDRKRHLRAPRSVCKYCNKKSKKNNGGGYTCDCTVQVVTKKAAELEMEGGKNNKSAIGRNLFIGTDVSPFTIHVQTNKTNANSSLHPVSFGKFLVKSNFRNIINGSVKRIGRTRISMAFSEMTDANAFLHDSRLEAENLTAYIPSFSITRMGLVRGIPAQWSEDEIVANISVPIGYGNVVKVRRLNRRVTNNDSVTWQPSETVVITFDGQHLPKRVFSCYNAIPVELYIFPTVQCFSCCKFGHTKTNCRSKPQCYKCGQMHTAETCSVNEENAFCFWCNGPHFATSRSCPEHKRQKDIKVTMANSCISYGEAAKCHPPIKKSFADVLFQHNPSPHQPTHQQTYSNSVGNGSRQNTSNQSQSYRKTIYVKPRGPPIRTNKGYDQAAHNALINEYSIPSPANGCALKGLNNNEPKTQSVAEAIVALITLLTKSNLVSSSHVAPLLEALAATFTQNGQDSSVELSKCN